MVPKKNKYTSLTGMYDILPEEQPWWSKLEKIVTALANFYGFSKISTPVLEKEGLFRKGTGESTEIVEKQMYSFSTQKGEKVVLRPEFTPSLVRAYIEKGMESQQKPVKLWTIGPLFRHERPQKGRYRQFNQFDFEAFGEDAPILDALVVQLSQDILQSLNCKDWSLQVNSIGCKECRTEYIKKLRSYAKKNKSKLCSQCQNRISKNPLRILDCKEKKCQKVINSAPKINKYLGEECEVHFEEFLDFLKAAKIPYEVNPYLVRGLDYYEKTVFEFVSVDQGKAQDTLIGGGRYNELVEKFGGQPTSAIGMGGGIERIVEEMKKQSNLDDIQVPKKNFEEKADVFLVQLGKLAKKKSLNILEKLRKENIKVAENLAKDTLKSQLQIADKKGAKITLILGEKECLEGTIIVRNMQSGVQEIVSQREFIKILRKRLRDNN